MDGERRVFEAEAEEEVKILCFPRRGGVPNIICRWIVVLSDDQPEKHDCATGIILFHRGRAIGVVTAAAGGRYRRRYEEGRLRRTAIVRLDFHAEERQYWGIPSFRKGSHNALLSVVGVLPLVRSTR